LSIESILQTVFGYPSFRGPQQAIINHVVAGGDALVLMPTDGRCLSVPLAWFPRLVHASPAQRANYELLGDGQGIHWPMVDEDISVMGMLAGQPSIEAKAALA
jgi:hypothetical protein